MWNTFLNINSGLVALAVGYLIYTFMAGIVTGAWHQFGIAVWIFIILCITEIFFGHFSD